MSITDQIVLVENALRDLIRDWERFFAGDLRVPPQNKHDRIDRRLRHLSQQTVQRRADQFRLENLQHRFMAYAANWNRMLREREEGRGQFARHTEAAPAAAGADANATANATAAANANATASANANATAAANANATASSSVHSTEIGSLYDRYVAAKRERGQEVRVDLKEFEAQIVSEKNKLESRLGHQVRFEVLVDDGKVKLAARNAGNTPSED
jgi:hypothetical protein